MERAVVANEQSLAHKAEPSRNKMQIPYFDTILAVAYLHTGTNSSGSSKVTTVKAYRHGEYVGLPYSSSAHIQSQQTASSYHTSQGKSTQTHSIQITKLFRDA